MPITGWHRHADGSLTTAVNVSRQAEGDRRALVAPFVGELVEVAYSYRRTAAEAVTIRGTLTTVARMADGSADLLVLEPLVGRSQAVKLATVVNVATLGPIQAKKIAAAE